MAIEQLERQIRSYNGYQALYNNKKEGITWETEVNDILSLRYLSWGSFCRQLYPFKKLYRPPSRSIVDASTT